MKRRVLLIIAVSSIFSLSCNYYKPDNVVKKMEILENDDKLFDDMRATENLSSTIDDESVRETTPIIEKDIISNAFIKLMNMQVWLWGERAWEFHVQNKDMSYEYYLKTEYDGHEKYEKIAVLFTQATVGDVFLNGYIVYERLVEEWGKPDFEFYTHWERETLEECREELIKRGFTTKLGSGIIYFGEAKQPDFGEVNEKKTKIIIDIAKTFMKEIGWPETITEFYVLDFDILSDYTQVLYANDNGYWETQFHIGGSYNKIYFVGENKYKLNQFKKIAYKINITDKDNPQIITMPEGK